MTQRTSRPVSSPMLGRLAPIRRLSLVVGSALLVSVSSLHGASIAAQWNFNDVGNATSSTSSIGGVPGAFNGVATRTAAGGGVSGGGGDYGFDVGGTTGAMVVTDAGAIGALNAISGGQALSISFWQFLDAIPASTAFWSTSPSAPAGTGNRGLSSHSPWENGRVYFDTGGCCDPPQRLDALLGHTLGTWEHIAFVYDNGTKTIYRGTTVVATAGGAAPLNTDFTNFIVGNDALLTNLGMDAKLDNFTVWNGALSAAEIAVLAVKPVPEPTAALLGMLALVGASMRRRRPSAEPSTRPAPRP